MTIAAAIAGTAALFGGLLVFELTGVLRAVSDALLRRAIGTLPEGDREDAGKRWREHWDSFDRASLSRLIWSASLLRQARRLAAKKFVRRVGGYELVRGWRIIRLGKRRVLAYMPRLQQIVTDAGHVVVLPFEDRWHFLDAELVHDSRLRHYRSLDKEPTFPMIDVAVEVVEQSEGLTTVVKADQRPTGGIPMGPATDRRVTLLSRHGAVIGKGTTDPAGVTVIRTKKNPHRVLMSTPQGPVTWHVSGLGRARSARWCLACGLLDRRSVFIER